MEMVYIALMGLVVVVYSLSKKLSEKNAEILNLKENNKYKQYEEQLRKDAEKYAEEKKETYNNSGNDIVDRFIDSVEQLHNN